MLLWLVKQLASKKQLDKEEGGFEGSSLWCMALRYLLA